MEHPHIIPVYAAGQADGLLYIAMRFVVGADLHALIRRDGPLPPRRAAAFISDMASALDAAHAVGVVHRDVKPANVLVDARPGRPEHGYLTDFGVARVMRSTGGLTIAGQFIGTPNYGAPEQISGAAVDGRTDQYALACVTYELLTGSVPFKREDPMMVLYAHAYADPPLLTAARPDLPAGVDAVLARGLAKRPTAATTVAATSPTRCGKPSASSPTIRGGPSKRAKPRSRRPRQSQRPAGDVGVDAD